MEKFEYYSRSYDGIGQFLISTLTPVLQGKKSERSDSDIVHRLSGDAV